MIYFITGGANSGKSAYAESLVKDLASHKEGSVYYIATATNNDNEMKDRVAKHESRRPDSWQLIEEPLLVSKKIAEHDKPESIFLIDCITLYLTNWFFSDNFTDLWPKEFDQLLSVLGQLQGTAILVSNEIGSGIIPMGESNRRFIDVAGEVNQQLAHIADKASLVVAGLPIHIKL